MKEIDTMIATESLYSKSLDRDKMVIHTEVTQTRTSLGDHLFVIESGTDLNVTINWERL